jgi:hypothetical protein
MKSWPRIGLRAGHEITARGTVEAVSVARYRLGLRGSFIGSKLLYFAERELNMSAFVAAADG